LIKEELSKVEEKREKYKKVRCWCEDETRLGLITKKGKKLTGKGIQPVGVEQWSFNYLWLYGLVEPRSGEGFDITLS